MENCSEWLELGPPPDTILTLPPPPLPSFLQVTSSNLSNCSHNVCEWAGAPPTGVHFVELSPPGVDGELDDTWLFVLISCSIGVLLLGSLLALLLLKCREERNSKTIPVRLESSLEVKKSCEAVMYPGDSSRVLWATLTPRGTTRTVASAQGTLATTFDNTGFSDNPEYRPRVSSPTRIEHPNLPPLNLPSHRTLKRSETSKRSETLKKQPPLL
ncbi:hypothetical protein GE061_020006 [Apolygus lucorum]|uniref:Uncharacterized protein n=1 Tax=Apolygus lucorum TaxID=248454 RepID=A0A8S9X9Z0_APOLU|nr:hypothetical protein GE061_020006 [Apolygus lucorum]